MGHGLRDDEHFPSFSEGLSLRAALRGDWEGAWNDFPSFSEGLSLREILTAHTKAATGFPFLFGGTFIEGLDEVSGGFKAFDFPSFSEGLSLRGTHRVISLRSRILISLPFRRDFH